MLREYKWLGGTWQFEETEAPSSAVVLSKEATVENKALTPENKGTRKPRRRTTTKQEHK